MNHLHEKEVRSTSCQQHSTSPAKAVNATRRSIDFNVEIAHARAEMANWPAWKKEATQLEGTDRYFDATQKQATQHITQHNH